MGGQGWCHKRHWASGQTPWVLTLWLWEVTSSLWAWVSILKTRAPWRAVRKTVREHSKALQNCKATLSLSSWQGSDSFISLWWQDILRSTHTKNTEQLLQLCHCRPAFWVCRELWPNNYALHDTYALCPFCSLPTLPSALAAPGKAKGTAQLYSPCARAIGLRSQASSLPVPPNNSCHTRLSRGRLGDSAQHFTKLQVLSWRGSWLISGILTKHGFQTPESQSSPDIPSTI